uniref:Uncharacterized protein n=1 Tax=Arundo donax TaxID=35708 RepID=A0A0A9BN04_ARUDO
MLATIALVLFLVTGGLSNYSNIVRFQSLTLSGVHFAIDSLLTTFSLETSFEPLIVTLTTMV